MTAAKRRSPSPALSRFKRNRLLLAALLLFAATSGTAAAAPGSNNPAPLPAQQSPRGASLLVQNVGQFDPTVQFVLLNGNQPVWVTNDAVWMGIPDPADPASGGPGSRESALARARGEGRSTTGTALRFTFTGSNPAATLEPFGRSGTAISYLTGDNPSRWRRNVPVWSGVRYRGLYPGIDLVIGDSAGAALPWRLEAQPGADLGAVAVRVDGANEVTASAGKLKLQLSKRSVDLALPRWALNGKELTSRAQPSGQDAFALAPGAAASDSPTEIAAPDSDFYQSVDGSAADSGNAIAVDYLGYIYLAGDTYSNDLPNAVGTYQGLGRDAFVIKTNGSGTTQFITYLGGTGDDIGYGIAVEGALPFIVGETDSPNFVGTTGSLGGRDAFVVALDYSGRRVRHVARFGGSNSDKATGIAVEGGSVYAVGTTESVIGPSSTNCTGASSDILVAKFDSALSNVYTRCLGGTDLDQGYGIAVRAGLPYVTGQTLSSGSGDIYLAKLDVNGNDPQSIIFGASTPDAGKAIALDTSGNVYIAGWTTPDGGGLNDFPLTSGGPPYAGGASDAVVVRLADGGGSFSLNFATRFGGPGTDTADGIAVDTLPAVFFTGTTAGGIPVRGFAYGDHMFGGEYDAYVARLYLGGGADPLTYSSYLGTYPLETDPPDQMLNDWGNGVTTDSGGYMIVGGSARGQVGTTVPSEAMIVKAPYAINQLAEPLNLVITASTDYQDALLNWSGPDPATYQVLRSQWPYFVPGPSTEILTPNPTTTSKTDWDALTTPGTYFYVVKMIDETSLVAGPSSNEVGKFTVELVLGD